MDMKIMLGAVISVQPFSSGMAWNWMQLATGLQRLGHRIYYVEQVDPRWCIDAKGIPCRLEHSVNHRIFRETMKRFGLSGRSIQIDMDGRAACGMSLTNLLRKEGEPDLLINMSGHIKSEAVLAAARRRVYVDQDPVYTQLWNAAYEKDLGFSQHDAFFTVGLNIGTHKTPIPDCGLQWHALLPTVVPDDWPVKVDATHARFTTIASWTSYSCLCYRDEWYGSKYEEFKRFAELPEKVDQGLRFEVAMRRYRDEEEGIRLLRNNGWRIFDSSHLSDLDSYQQYIAGSRAEIGIAKNAYVKSRSGWFSDRSAHYLASGKPVLAQATGFEEHLPTGHGLLGFSTMEEAIEGVERIKDDYAGHCRAARQIACEYLDYRRVVPAMLEAAFSAGPAKEVSNA